MAKFPQDHVYAPQFTPDPFGYASAPSTDRLNSIQAHVHQDLRRLYDLYRTQDLQIGTRSARASIDASNFTINAQAVRDGDYLSRLRQAIAQNPTRWTSTGGYTDVADLRALRVPMEVHSDYTAGAPGYRDGGGAVTVNPIYQDSYNGVLMGAMDSVDYRYRSVGTAITFSAQASDGTELVTATTDSRYVFDQSKETQVVLTVDREIEDETGKTNEPYEELILTITTSPSISNFNALHFEFGLPMDIASILVGSPAAAATDENSEDLNAIVSTSGSKYHFQVDNLYENVTRRTVFLASSSDPVTVTLRSSHWVPWNDSGTVKKRFLFPIYNIDAINYTPTSGSSYGVAKVVIPKEWDLQDSASDAVMWYSTGPIIADLNDSGVHVFPTFIREASQSSVLFFDTESDARDLVQTTHSLSASGVNEMWARIKLDSGTYVPRIDAAFAVYEIDTIT